VIGADAGGSSAMKVTHAKHVWVPIQLALSRSLAKEATLIRPSQLLAELNHRFL